MASCSLAGQPTSALGWPVRLGILSVLISNKTVSVARKLRWSTCTTLACRHTAGEWPISLLLSFFLSFFSQASTIMAKAITMIQARTNWIFFGVLHPSYSVFKEIE